jgi:hypothetical protein
MVSGGRICVRCDSLGDATDTEEVLVEIRAAELVAAWKPIGGVGALLTPSERDGWSDVDDTLIADGYLAGWLAYSILVHDDEHGDTP